jgi:hypothetical protein
MLPGIYPPSLVTQRPSWRCRQAGRLGLRLGAFGIDWEDQERLNNAMTTSLFLFPKAGLLGHIFTFTF